MKRMLLSSTFAAAVLLAQSKPQTVKDDNYPLRGGCSDTAEQVAALKKGDPIRIRYALSGGGRPCYAVSVETGGKKLQGYVWADGLTGLEEFEQARRAASSAASSATGPIINRGEVEAVRQRTTETQKAGKIDFALAAQLNLAADALQSGRPADAEKILAKAGAPRGNRDFALLRAFALMQMNQPDGALDILTPALRENPKDPRLLEIAGRAAYASDDGRRALAYWRESLELRPDADLEKLLRRVEKEMGADKSGEKSYGTRFLLRYDTAVASPELARSMVDALDQEFSRVSFQLGCPADERIVTIVQTRETYRQTTGSAEWTGGLYDGKIRIPLAPSRQIDPETRRTFAHEIVHACLANLGRWPAWLHEGLAQKLAGESLRPAQRDVLKVLARAGKLPQLEALGKGWGSMNVTQASVAYSVALAAIEIFFEKYGQEGPRNLMNNPPLLDQMTPELDRKLQESLK